VKDTGDWVYKQKGTAADLENGDFVRRRMTFDPTGITKGAKIGYWSKEVYRIDRVIQNRKDPNIVASYKIKSTDDGTVVSGSIPRGELLKVVNPDEMAKLPTPAVRPGPVDEGTNAYSRKHFRKKGHQGNQG
ncbi:hypothetical protein HDV00_012236, partial [Rhizophlyctis rosea]